MIRLILMTDFTEAFAHNLLRGILDYSRYSEPWVVCRMPLSFKLEHGLIGVLEWAKHWKAQAIIGQFDADDPVEIFAENHLFAVAQDFKRRFTCIPNIISPNEEIGRMGAEYFMKKGFRNFAFYGYKNVVWSDERRSGFQKAIHEVRGGTSFIYENQSLDNLWFYDSEPLAEWLKSLPLPIALMACDDTRANIILEVCRVLQLRVPEDVAVLGVDNDELTCNLSSPSLSSVNANIMQGGYDTAALITEGIRNPNIHLSDVIIQPTNIVERMSTDIFATSDPIIVKALQFIHRNIATHFSVNDLIREVPMSRRLFEIRFKQALGTSVLQYIIDLRLKRFCQYLISSDEPIADLALRVGWDDFKNLARLFKQRKGCTPSEYKRKYSMKQKEMPCR